MTSKRNEDEVCYDTMNSFRVHLFPILPTLILLSSVYAHARTFTNSDGRTIDGEIVKATDDSVVIKRDADLRMFTIKTSSLSSEDQAYVLKWRTDNPGLRIKIETKKVTGDREVEQMGRVRNKTRKTWFDITITNNGPDETPELTLHYEQILSGMLTKIPKDMRGTQKVPALAAGASTTLFTPPVKLVDQSAVFHEVARSPSGKKTARTTGYESKASLKGICVIVMLNGKEVAASNTLGHNEVMTRLRTSVRTDAMRPTQPGPDDRGTTLGEP